MVKPNKSAPPIDEWSNMRFTATSSDVLGNIDNMIVALNELSDVLQSDATKAFEEPHASDKTLAKLASLSNDFKSISKTINSSHPHNREDKTTAAYRENKAFGKQMSDAFSDGIRVLFNTTGGFGTRATGSSQRSSLTTFARLSGAQGKMIMNSLARVAIAQDAGNRALEKLWEADTGHRIVGRRSSSGGDLLHPIKLTGVNGRIIQDKADATKNSIGAANLLDTIHAIKPSYNPNNGRQSRRIGRKEEWADTSGATVKTATSDKPAESNLIKQIIANGSRIRKIKAAKKAASAGTPKVAHIPTPAPAPASAPISFSDWQMLDANGKPVVRAANVMAQQMADNGLIDRPEYIGDRNLGAMSESSAESARMTPGYNVNLPNYIRRAALKHSPRLKPAKTPNYIRYAMMSAMASSVGRNDWMGRFAGNELEASQSAIRRREINAHRPNVDLRALLYPDTAENAHEAGLKYGNFVNASSFRGGAGRNASVIAKMINDEHIFPGYAENGVRGGSLATLNLAKEFVGDDKAEPFNSRGAALALKRAKENATRPFDASILNQYKYPVGPIRNQQYGPARINYPSMFDFREGYDEYHPGAWNNDAGMLQGSSDAYRKQETDYAEKIRNEIGWRRFAKGTALEKQDNGAFAKVQASLNAGPKLSTKDKIISEWSEVTDEMSKVPWLKAGKAADAMGKMFMNMAKISDDTFTGASDMFTAMGDMTTNPIGAFTGMASGAGELLGGMLGTTPALMGGISGMFGAVSGSSMGSGGGGGSMGGNANANASAKGAKQGGVAKGKGAGLAGGVLGFIGGAFSAFSGLLQIGVAGIQGSMKMFSSMLGLVMKIQKMILGSSPVFQAIQNILNLALTMLFLPLATAFSNQLIPVVESILNFTMTVGQKLAALVGTIDEAQLATFTAKMAEMADKFEVTTEGLGSEFWDKILNNITELAKIIVGKEFQDFIVNMLGLIPDLLLLAVSVANFLSDNSALIAEVVRKGLDIIKTLLDGDMLTTIMNGVIHILESVAKFEKENGKNFFDFIVPIIQTMSDTLLKISDYLTGAKAVTDYVTGGYNNVKDNGNGSFWKGLFKSLSPTSPFEDMRKKLTGNYATGGYIPATNGGQLVTVAEGGEGEYIIPESKMGGTGITINISGPVYGMDDFKSKVKQVMTEVTGASYYR